ncbi:MAG: hypothetical protein K2X62_03715 [Beijerinckiaceae bacterium]|nr:hypothetical protein [Beijerinckiaceae bacterium]MDO9443593.1 hypothetical protein [Beijerinckiaceae bacterium]
MPHKFKCSEMVLLNQLGFTSSKTSTATVYEVVRLMPADQYGEVSYRIKAGTIERAVRESEIRST